MIFRSTRLDRFSIDSIDSIDQLRGLVDKSVQNAPRMHQIAYSLPKISRGNIPGLRQCLRRRREGGGDGKAPIVENVVAPLCASVDMCDVIRLIDVDITT